MPKAKKQIIVVKPQLRKKVRKATKVANRTSMKSIIKNIGSTVGSVYGPMGSRIGAHAGDYIARIMGQGDYKVSKNTLLTNNGPPSFATNGDDVIIKHREFVKDVPSSIAFSNTNFLINPGNATLFPWLSQFATSFEEYEFLGLIVEYKSTSGSAIASTNNALGTVIIATDYNCSNANMTTKRAMETVEFSTSAGTDTSIIHPIECDKSRNVLSRQYTTNATTTAGVADPKFHFLGNLQLAVVGQQANSITIGEMWVSYQIRLSRPTFESLSQSPPTSTYYNHSCYELGLFNGLVVNGALINGYQDLYTTGVIPQVVFKPNFVTDDTDPRPIMPPGIYDITYHYVLNNDTGSTLTNVTALPPQIDLNTHSSGLVVAIDDATQNYGGSQSSAYVGTPPATIPNGTEGNWGGFFRVVYRPQDDSNTAPYLAQLGTYQYSGGTSIHEVYTCDVTCTYISPINEEVQVFGNSKDEEVDIKPLVKENKDKETSKDPIENYINIISPGTKASTKLNLRLNGSMRTKL